MGRVSAGFEPAPADLLAGLGNRCQATAEPLPSPELRGHRREGNWWDGSRQDSNLHLLIYWPV